MYRAIYRLRGDGDWDLMAVFGLDVTHEEMPFHRLEVMFQEMFGHEGQDTFKEFEFDSLSDVVDVLEGDESQTKEE